MESSSVQIDRNTVIVKRLSAEHGRGTFAHFVPLGAEMVEDIRGTVGAIFSAMGGAALIKSSGDVYIKPNAVGPQPYSYTRPEVLEAAIGYWYGAGARRVYVIENSTQGALTRTVFEMTGYGGVCKRAGAQPVYLDEDETVSYPFSGKGPASEREPKGYESMSFGMPRTVAEKLVEGKDQNLYVSIPKLKTHSMTVVTFGVKNQWGFVPHADRIVDHNYNLHNKLVDLLALVRPDVTLIEGVEGTIYGHYPPLALADKCVRPFKVLIGGLNVVATDVVGARVFGLGIEDVPHLGLAVERGLSGGIEKLEDVPIAGDLDAVENIDLLNEMSEFGGKYPHSLYPAYPDDVRVIVGGEMACTDGCLNASLSGIQLMSLDSGGKGGWTLVTGKGFDDEEVEKLTGRVLVTGGCAVGEVGQKLVTRLGKKNVYLVDGCCDLTGTTEALCHLMRVAPFNVGSSARRLSTLKGLAIIVKGKLNRSHGRQINVFSKAIKRR